MDKIYLDEMVPALTPLLALEEASRCLLCLDAPCSKGCPAYTDPAKFIRSLRFKNVTGAAMTIRLNNPLGGICARVCPTEKYCEKACSHCGIDRPINISGLQRYLTDYEASINLETYDSVTLDKSKVAVIGSGPAGITAANMLAQAGHPVTVFEASKELGGYLRTGIPEYRLPNHVVDKEISYTAKLGVKFVTNKALGKDFSLESLKADGYKAILLATGFSGGRILPSFESGKNVESAVSFLARVKEAQGKVKLGSSLLVVGGGDVAMDVATTAKILGVKKVYAVARETNDVFPASKAEKLSALQNEVTIIDGFTPELVEGSKVTFASFDSQDKLVIDAEHIILAIGQANLLPDLGLKVERGEIVVDENYQSSVPGIFAAGDLVKGDKSVVYAIKTGKAAAVAIDQYLGGK